MTEVDAVGQATRERRRTWMLGGALFAASALVGLWLQSFPSMPLGRLPDLLFSLGAVIFAVGLGSAGSVTGRRPLGTGAIIALAAWQLLSWLVADFVIAPMLDGGFADDSALMTAAMISTTFQVLALILAVIAVVQIGRAAVLPRPWRWAPLWALLAVVAVRLLQAATGIGGLPADQATLVALYGLGNLIIAAAVVFLGVLALTLAVRPAPESTVVYESNT